MNERPAPPVPDAPTLGEIGLHGYAPYLMNRIMGRYNASLREQMSALGLTTPKMRALAVLSVVDGVPVGRLAVYTVTDPSTLSRAIDQLEAQGLARRAADPEDARASRIHATDDGRAAFARLWPTMRAAYDAMFAGVPEPERAAFTATLQRVLANIRRHDF